MLKIDKMRIAIKSATENGVIKSTAVYSSCDLDLQFFFVNVIPEFLLHRIFNQKKKIFLYLFLLCTFL